MRAAIVSGYDNPPSYGIFPEPVAGSNEIIVEVLATPLSPIVRSIAAGKHYSVSSTEKFVPGIDGVGITPDGEKVYFLFPRTPFGSMAQYALVSRDAVVPVPDGIDDAHAAVVVTGGLSSWVALTLRARFREGESVLINGATGSAGSLAVQIASYMGASKIIATGRNRAKLDNLPDEVTKIALDENAEDALRKVFDDGVDVVLDYLWGGPASLIIQVATAGRGARSGEPRLRFVQMGSIAGETISLSASSLRSSGLELLGSGIGSLSSDDLVQGAGQLLLAIKKGHFEAPHVTYPLASITQVWNEDTGDRRIVFIP